MTEVVFASFSTRLLIAAAVGIILLLALIIRFKLHPVISMMIAAIVIGVGAGMPLHLISETVEKGVGQTLKGIALLIGLGSMFGGILEVSGGAQKIAKTLIDKLGQSKAGWALGLTGMVIGTTVFFEAGVVILIPHAQGHLTVVAAESLLGHFKRRTGTAQHLAQLFRHLGPLPQILQEDGLLGYADGLISDALQIGDHAERPHHETQIAGHGLGAGQQAQGLLVDLVFQIVYDVIPIDDGRRAGRAPFVERAKAFIKRDADRGAHDQQTGTQAGNGLSGKLFLMSHGKNLLTSGLPVSGPTRKMTVSARRGP